MPIKRRQLDVRGFKVMLNVPLVGSKTLSPTEQEAALTTDRIHVTIVDANDPSRVLFEGDAEAREFSSGNVGFHVSASELSFQA